MTRVRTGSKYTFNASFWDITDRRDYTPKNGTVVRVMQPFGCPKNNTMGQCYIETLEGKFLGMVSVHSLQKATK
jgi:hypothetical protein